MLCAMLALLGAAEARVYDFMADGGALPDDAALSTAWKNGMAMNTSLAALKPGDTLHVPNRTFHVMGGIYAVNLTSVVIRIDGSLVMSDSLTVRFLPPHGAAAPEWPRNLHGQEGQRPGHTVLDCIFLHNSVNVTLTSSGVGTLDGKGSAWWGIPGIGYLQRQENRPKLLTLDTSRDVLVENLRLINSPYWTFWAPNSNGLEVRFTTIDARRTHGDSHSTIDLTAFNTDGFDVTGTNVWIHAFAAWAAQSKHLLEVLIRAFNPVAATVTAPCGIRTTACASRCVYIDACRRGRPHAHARWPRRSASHRRVPPMSMQRHRNQRPCVLASAASQGESSNMLFERIHASGVGLTI
eukprot:392532-Prymnesium_polylepis.1